MCSRVVCVRLLASAVPHLQSCSAPHVQGLPACVGAAVASGPRHCLLLLRRLLTLKEELNSAVFDLKLL